MLYLQQMYRCNEHFFLYYLQWIARSVVLGVWVPYQHGASASEFWGTLLSSVDSKELSAGGFEFLTSVEQVHVSDS